MHSYLTAYPHGRIKLEIVSKLLSKYQGIFFLRIDVEWPSVLNK